MKRVILKALRQRSAGRMRIGMPAQAAMLSKNSSTSSTSSKLKIMLPIYAALILASFLDLEGWAPLEKSLSPLQFSSQEAGQLPAALRSCIDPVPGNPQAMQFSERCLQISNKE